MSDVNDDDRHDDAGDEQLFDDYLDAALSGAAEDPATFLSRRTSVGTEMHDRLAAIHRLVAPSTDAGASPPESLGGYLLLRKLGEGGMGVVHLAEQVELGRRVALKVIRPELSTAPEAAARFRREARAVAALRHPSIVNIFEAGTERGVLYFAMEYVEGRGLDEILAEERANGARPPVIARVREAAAVADALACAHARGIVHRDVKPSNIRIRPDGTAVLLDFGLALVDELDGLSRTGAFLGSPHYASPEALFGARASIDARSDVYSLGATLYEALSGRAVFEGSSLGELAARAAREEPVPLRRLAPFISRDLETVVMKALEREPVCRYQDAGALRDDLAAILELRPVTARRPSIARRASSFTRRRPAAAMLIVLIALGAILAPIVQSVRRRADLDRRRVEADDLCRRAEEKIVAYGHRREEGAVAYWEAERLARASTSRWLSSEEDAALRRHRRAVHSLYRDREAFVGEVVDLLTRASLLDVADERVRHAWAAFWFERWLDHRGSEYDDIPTLYRDLVRSHDDDGTWSTRVEGRVPCEFITDPSGAEVHLFRYVDLDTVVAGAESRSVPLPIGGRSAVTPGAMVARVMNDGGGLRAGDLILAVEGRSIDQVLEVDGGACVAGSVKQLVRQMAAGGISVDVQSDGISRRLRIEGGSGPLVRVTAAPLVIGEPSRLGLTPIEPRLLAPGAYVAVVRREGHEERRVPFHVDHQVEAYAAPLRIVVTLEGVGVTPEGFVHVGPTFDGRDASEFWMLDHEVTVAEWRGFGGDAAVLLSTDDDDLPATGMTFDEASRFAEGYAAASGLDARGFVSRLPRTSEWARAGKGGDSRTYVFGRRFSPRFVKSRHARPTRELEPILSFPVDESPYGIHDLAGSVSEWCTTNAGREEGDRRSARSGSFDVAEAEGFEIEWRRRVAATSREPWIGLRIVLERGARK